MGYKLAPGWTRERMIQTIQNGNTGRKSLSEFSKEGMAECAYRGVDGNRCAIGCFIPDWAYSPKMESMTVGQLLDVVPELWEHMPLVSMDGLQGMQFVHDKLPYPTPFSNEQDPRPALEAWILANVDADHVDAGGGI